MGVACHLLRVEPVDGSAEHDGNEDCDRGAVRVPVTDVAAHGRPDHISVDATSLPLQGGAQGATFKRERGRNGGGVTWHYDRPNGGARWDWRVDRQVGDRFKALLSDERQVVGGGAQLLCEAT